MYRERYRLLPTYRQIHRFHAPIAIFCPCSSTSSIGCGADPTYDSTAYSPISSSGDNAMEIRRDFDVTERARSTFPREL